MAMLDKRLKRMEDRVIKIIPKEDLRDTSQRSSVRPPLPGTVAKNDKNEENNKRSVDEAFTTELQEWSKDKTGSGPLDHAAKVRTQKESENKLFSEGAEALPPQHLQEHLAEVFFDCIYGQSYLLLHKPSFMRKLKAGTVPPVLLLAICAISARFSTHPQVNSEPAFLRGEQWATPARKIVEKRHFEPNITILTCMIILGLHYFGTCEGGLSWSFGGQASRMGYALQLHKELDHDPLGLAQAERAAATGRPAPRLAELSFTDREIRRRTMWACYLMDTFNSSGTERPSFLNEDYMSIQLPVKESNFQMEIPGHTEALDGHVPLSTARSSLEDPETEARGNMGVAAYVIRAVNVWKRIVKYLNLGGKEKDAHPIWDPLSQFASLQRQIAQLKASLPASLEYSPENLQAHATERLANQFIFLHIVIAQNSLFLHRFAIPTAPNTHRPYPPNTPSSFLATAATTVLDAATRVSKLLADSTGHTLTVPFAGYCAYSSATVHVWGIFSRNAMLEATSRENLRHNYKYLNRMKRHWGMFHYMAESVKDTYRAFADAASRMERKQRAKMNRSESARVEPLESGVASAEQLSSGAASSGEENELGERPGQVRVGGTKGKVFQYGDWFNKYPHGVSEREWEQNHLPHRSETQKGTEAVMSQRAELQSVEEFFASLSPPSKADDGPNRKKMARRRGKSIADEKTKQREAGSSDQHRKPSASARKPSQAGSDVATQRPSISSHSLYPLSHQTFPQLDPPMDLCPPELDVPMSGLGAGLKSSQGHSAFDLASPAGLFSGTSRESNYNLASRSTPSSGRQPAQPAQANNANSPFDYTSPSGSSATGTNNNSGINFPFNYTSAVPQLDRQMVFGGYVGIDPWESSGADMSTGIDMDGMTGFNDPSFGLNTGTGVTATRRSVGGDESLRSPTSTAAHFQPYGHLSNHSHPHHQNMSSTAWIMPFNIEPPNATLGAAGGTPGGGFDDFAAFEGMDLGFEFSPGMRDG